MLLKEWGLPSSLEEAIRYHLEPSKAEVLTLEVNILHIAGTVTECRLLEIPEEYWPNFIWPAVWESVNVSQETLGSLIQETDQELNSLLDLIYSHSAATV